MMRSAIAVAGLAMTGAFAAADVTVGIDPSDAPWLGFMNVSELPENGGAFVFASTWGVGDLVASFDDAAQTVTMFPNQIGDPNEFWYQEAPGGDPTDPNNGGPGAPGNKIMEANLFQQVNAGDLTTGVVTFEGTLLSNSFTDAHTLRVFIRDFNSGFGDLQETIIELDSPGDFSISLDITDDPSRIVQWGIQVTGVNVWITDVEPFGSATFAYVPAPGAAALAGAAGLFAARRRR